MSGRRHFSMAGLLLAAVGLVGLRGLPAQAEQTDTEQTDAAFGAWFVDLGRDYALSHAEQAVEADAAVALCFMKAAARLQPDLADAYYWQLDLLRALGRDDEALTALEKYVTHQPEDHLARLMLVDSRIHRFQTAEDRQAFCERTLQQGGLGRTLISDLHRRIAEFYYNRADFEEARKHVRHALDAFSLNLAATRLGHELSESDESPATYVELVLQMLAANPAQPQLLWELADYLAGLSLHTEANAWYAYAAEVILRTQPGTPIPPALLLDWAQCQLDGGDPAAAEETCNNILERDPSLAQVRILLMDIGRAAGNTGLVTAQAEILKEHYRNLTATVRKNNDAAEAARMAWFYSRYAPNKELASGFARIAAAKPTSDIFIRRAIGCAHLLNERYDEAIQWLEPLASADQRAAFALARAYEKLGRKKDALSVLLAAAKLRFSGQAYHELLTRIKTLGGTPPVPPDREGVNRVLARFDRRVLDFFRRPNDFLRLEMIPEHREWAFAEPWRITFRMKNVGPFPITLGQGLMIVPRLMLSAVMSGPEPSRHDHYLLFGLNRRPALLPNEFVETTITVDVGPIRREAFLSPQLRREITFTLLLDPVRLADGTGAHRLSGLSVAPVSVTRIPVDADEPAVAVLLSKARGGTPEQRINAAVSLVALLAEHDRFEAGDARYDHLPIPDGYIVKMLIDRARDDSPLVRARTLEALRYLHPRDSLIQAMAPRLSDPQWPVRFLAMYALAESQGERFTKVLARAAETDPDPLLREFAAAYGQRMSKHQPATAPTTHPTGSSP